MNKAITSAQIQEVVNGQIVGDAHVEVTHLKSLEEAGPGCVTFAVGDKQKVALSKSTASLIILPESLVSAAPHATVKMIVGDAYLAYAQVSVLFETRVEPEPEIHPSAIIHPTANLGQQIYIGPNVVIEADATIGEGSYIGANSYIGARSTLGKSCRIHPNVTLYHDVRLGQRVTIHSSTVIGGDGFGFAPSAEGWVKIRQIGGVEIGDDVEIGSGTTIDRGALGDTIIESGVILDNQIQIAHNVHIKSDSAIAACVGIAGSTVIGERCTIAGGVGINGHIEIADGVHFSGNTTVTRSIREPGSYSSGTVVEPTAQWRKNAARFRSLDELFRRVRNLEKQLS